MQRWESFTFSEPVKKAHCWWSCVNLKSLLHSREQYVKCTLEIFDILEFPVFLESFEKLCKQIRDQNELEMQFKWLSM